MSDLSTYFDGDNKLTKSDVDPLIAALAARSEMAEAAARPLVFSEYLERKARHTIRRQRADLALLARFVAETKVIIDADSLQQSPYLWQGIRWGLIEAFKRWMLQQGYSMGSVNVRLSTIKRYARLAMQAGAMDGQEYQLIRAVQGYTYGEGLHIDEARSGKGTPVRVGRKKSTAIRLTEDQAAALKNQPDSPQGRRDRVLMCLLLDHGLRAGEVSGLKVEHIHIGGKSPHMTFYRPKVRKTQTHRLTADSLGALQHWMMNEAPALGPLLRGSRRWGALTKAGMNTASITARVRLLGEQIGVRGLSAHDCRHYWATRAAEAGSDPFALQEAGGWNSLAMPRRYIALAQVANMGIKGFEEQPTK